MSKILKNPADGAPISDVQIRGQKYFVEKPFEVNSLVKLEDDEVADDLLELFEFLALMTPEDAKSWKEEQAKKKYPCDKCEIILTTQQGLDSHKEVHERDEKLDKELGLEVIKSAPVVESVKKEKETDPITQLARDQGLDYGEGLVNL